MEILKKIASKNRIILDARERGEFIKDVECASETLRNSIMPNFIIRPVHSTW